MFTGLVEEIGRIARQERRGPGARLTIATSMKPLVLGESIAVDGVCLTVDRIVGEGFEADASVETLERTTLGRSGGVRPVHLERATPLGGRLGGHLVMGHVDAVARVAEVAPAGDARRIALRVPADLAPFVAEKGSIAVDGVSLTLNGVTDAAGEVVVEMVVVPHTLGATRLGELRPGDRVNVEVDVLARYVARQLALVGSVRPGSPAERKTSPHDPDDDQRILRKLREGGFG
jgi:riboflavin synthase